MKTDSSVVISLTRDQALVRFELLTRADAVIRLPDEHQAEERVLWETRPSSSERSWSRSNQSIQRWLPQRASASCAPSMAPTLRRTSESEYVQRA
jgi:hypothetical protein